MSYQPHIVAAPNEFKLPWQPHVGVSDVKFGPEGASNLVAVSGWDGSVYVYNVQNPNDIVQKIFYFHGRPVLNCTFAGSTRLASGGLDRSVKLADLETGKQNNIGHHDNGIRCVRYSRRQDLVVSGGWDNCVKLWDPRSLGVGSVQTATCSDRVYAMDVRDEQVLVGTRDRKIYIFDLRNMRDPVQLRDSPLKYQTRAVAFFPKDEAFVVSSIEGRVAIEYIRQDSDDQKKKYAFKCHRSKDSDGVELIYPVNTIAFHPTYSSFGTGGSDGHVNIWDPFNRKRLVQLHKFETSIVSIDISAEGDKMAIASSYNHELDTEPSPIPASTITVRALSESDTRIKI